MSKAAGAQVVAQRPMDRGIPVGLNEAALDSPTFRASAAHFAEQIDALEKWLNGYVSSTSRLVHDILTLEESIIAPLFFRSTTDAFTTSVTGYVPNLLSKPRFTTVSVAP